MKVVGLFAGIGGLERGLAQAGHEAVLTAEIDPAAAAVLAARLPGVPNVADVRDIRDLPSDADIVAAGFPCQDLSQAGETRGIDGARSGLIVEVLRLLERRRAPWVVLENVSFMLHLHGGRALDLILSRLEELGYRWAYRVVDTLAFGLPQRRERVFIVAARDADPADVLLVDDVVAYKPATRLGEIAHGFYWTEGIRGLGWAPDAVPTLKNGSTIGIPSPPAILMPDGTIVTPDIRDAERLQGFPTDWTAPAAAVKRASVRWSLVGNAVSVPVAAWLGARLSNPGRYDRVRDRPLIERRSWPRAARFDGHSRHRVEVTSAPIDRDRPALHRFLNHPGSRLSVRATAGFLGRTARGTLRFPDGFIAAVEGHLASMKDGARGEAMLPAGGIAA